MHKLTRILLVEDNEGDIVLINEALKEVSNNHELTVVRDGEQALQFIERKGVYENLPTPHFVILDLNLPKVEGKVVLSTIKGNSELKKIPVVVLTTSNSESDISESYALNANGYIIKPIGFRKFTEVVASLSQFWINIVELPKIKNYE
jgi:CheY-like chemotaxis protein